MKLKLFLILALGGLVNSNQALAYQVSFGIFQVQDKTQDADGNKETNPYDPSLSFGRNFEINSTYTFSPQVGYIKNKVTSNDSYGKYEVQTLFIHYDFIYKPDWFAESVNSRFGIGQFMKTIRGDGGTVTVPNGAGTATSYRPGKSRTTYTSTINLGFEWVAAQNTSLEKMVGLRAMLYLHELLDSQKTLMTYYFGVTGYF